MAREQLSQYNVVATFPDMAAARKAFDALEAAGVEVPQAGPAVPLVRGQRLAEQPKVALAAPARVGPRLLGAAGRAPQGLIPLGPQPLQPVPLGARDVVVLGPGRLGRPQPLQHLPCAPERRDADRSRSTGFALG